MPTWKTSGFGAPQETKSQGLGPQEHRAMIGGVLCLWASYYCHQSRVGFELRIGECSHQSQCRPVLQRQTSYSQAEEA